MAWKITFTTLGDIRGMLLFLLHTRVKTAKTVKKKFQSIEKGPIFDPKSEFRKSKKLQTYEYYFWGKHGMSRIKHCQTSIVLT